MLVDAASVRSSGAGPGSGRRRGSSRPRSARGGRLVVDRKDPITREPYFDGDAASDGEENATDENERTPMASIRA